MTELHIQRGLPASGKTTAARAWVSEDPTTRARVNRDDIRAMLFERPDYSWPQEQATTEASRAMAGALLDAGRDVVIDDTNLRPKYVREWVRFGLGHGVEGFKLHDRVVSVEEAIARDAARARNVGAEVIRRMADRFVPGGSLLPVQVDDLFEDPTVEPYTPPADAPPVILVDIDGTIALHGDRSPYDLTRVHEDQPNTAVIRAVEHAMAAGVAVVFCSGREATSRTETRAWLDTHLPFVRGCPLLMRAEGDRRKDSVVKRELFDAHVRGWYDVLYVLDDRNQVVQMWRSLGLTVFQVADGDF